MGRFVWLVSRQRVKMNQSYRNYNGRFSQPETRQARTFRSFFNKTDRGRAQNYDSNRALNQDMMDQDTSVSSERKKNYNNNNQYVNKANTRGGRRSSTNHQAANENSRIEAKLDDMMRTLDDKLINALSSVANRTSELERNSKNVEKALDSHSRQLNDLNQMKLAQKMEIQGLTYPFDCDEEQLTKIVFDYFSQLSIQVKEHEVLHIYGFEKIMKEETRMVIVVVFSHEAVRKRVMQAKFAIKDLNDGVYFSNCLTRYNAGLLTHAKNLQKEGKIFKAFFMGLNVYVLTKEGDQKIKIEGHDHLQYIEETAHNQVHQRKTHTTSKPQRRVLNPMNSPPQPSEKSVQSHMS